MDPNQTPRHRYEDETGPGEDAAMSVYDAIATFGLTETADSLPLPETADDRAALAGRAAGEAFKALTGPMQGTGLEPDIEPLAHGLASLLHRHWQAGERTLERARDTLAGLLRTAGASEVADVKIEQATARLHRLDLKARALEEMAGQAARAYAAETGRPFQPTGRAGRSPKPALTGAVFEARELLETHAAQEAARLRVEGSGILFGGDRDWPDANGVWDVLDRVRARLRNGYGEAMVLCHKGDRKGADAIAVGWARTRGVAQIVFQPNWRAYGKAAGFRAIDEMLGFGERVKRPVRGAVAFGTSGPVLNLTQKAEAQGLRVLHVRPEARD